MPIKSTWGAGANAEAIAAWDGPLFDRFVRYRHLLTSGLAIHGEEALRLFPPAAGERVLDIGCGFGDTTQRLAELVGPEGAAVGVDAAANFIEVAEREQAGVANVSFRCGDVQTLQLGGPYDLAFSRMGTMFFANPVAALRNVRHALRPGGRLNMVVWRRKLDNDWVHRAETVVEQFLDRPEEYEQPTCGPGPFSMAGADTVTDVLKHAGFDDIQLKRQDLVIKVGDDLDNAVDLVMSIGPAGEVLRLWGDRVDEIRPKVRAALLDGMADMAREDGVYADSSTWAVRAVAPA
jgi:SAM-dependent methyltransferase